LIRGANSIAHRKRSRRCAPAAHPDMCLFADVPDRARCALSWTKPDAVFILTDLGGDVMIYAMIEAAAKRLAGARAGDAFAVLAVCWTKIRGAGAFL